MATRLRDEPPSDPDALYTELRTILFETRSRDELKFAIVLVGTYERAEDAEAFRVLARHEEFTFFAAAALAYGADDWVGEWLALLPDASSGGATELSRLLLHARTNASTASCFAAARRSAMRSTSRSAGSRGVGLRRRRDDLRRGARSILDGLRVVVLRARGAVRPSGRRDRR